MTILRVLGLLFLGGAALLNLGLSSATRAAGESIPTCIKSADTAPARRCVALVIGNGAYTKAGRLPNAVNDARVVGAALGRVGFDVMIVEDLTAEAFEQTVAAFVAKARGADVALFFYAGHALQLGSINYLMPIDAKLASELAVKRETISAQDIVELMEGAARMNLVFLDACRNNPLAEQLQLSLASSGRAASVGRGLARMSARNHDTLIVFSTAPGNEALDQEGGAANSPFAIGFLAHLETPGIEIDLMVKRVTRTVRELTKSQQQPERLSKLESEFYFKPAAALPPVVATPVPAPQAILPAKELPSEKETPVVEPVVTPEVSATPPLKVDPPPAVLPVAPPVAPPVVPPVVVKPPVALPPIVPPVVVAPPVATPPPSPKTAMVDPPPIKTTPVPKAPQSPMEPSADCEGVESSWLGEDSPRQKILSGEAGGCHIPGDGTAYRSCWQDRKGERVCGPEMVVVPAGRFLMGSPPDEIAALTKTSGNYFKDEGPQRVVEIKRPFAVGKHEVTVGEYLDCVATRRCRPPIWQEAGSEFNIRTGQNDTYRKMGPALTNANYPIVGVSWVDATAYAAWLSEKTGEDYRLLTEAEWEYAARAVTEARSQPKYHFGNNPNDLCDYGNVGDLTAKEVTFGGEVANCQDGHVYAAPVGSFKPNPWGLYDIHGNVWEWVRDCYTDTYRNAPTDGSARDTGDCSRRVVRSGAWIFAPRTIRVANRDGNASGNRVFYTGFRVARTLDKR